MALTKAHNRMIEGAAVNVKDFGAVGDGVTDDTAAIQAAIDAGSKICIPAGTYILSSTITLSDQGATIIGDGVNETIIKASHSAGPVIKMTDFFQHVESLTISATSGRQSGVAGTNIGLLIEPDDVSGAEAKFPDIRNIEVEDQPSHGIAFVAGFFCGELSNFRINNCGGHGLLIDNGDETSRTNKRRPGGISVRDGVIQDCIGHGILAGQNNSTDNVPYRLLFDNIDIYRCAITSGARLDLANSYIYAVNSEIRRCAFNGYAGPGQGPATVNGLVLAGRNLIVSNIRFVDVTSYCVKVENFSEYSTLDVRIESFRHSSNAATTLSQAVINNADSHTVHVSTDVYFFLDKLKTNDELSIADDSAVYLGFSSPTRGVITLSSNVSSKPAGIIHFRVGDSNGHATVMCDNGNTITTTTGTLNGTTGSNGNFTVSADLVNDRLYIENRTNNSISYTFDIICSNATIFEGVENA